MSQCMLVQEYKDGSDLKNYVPCDETGAAVIASMLTGEVSIWKSKSSNTNNVSKTREAKIKLINGGSNVWLNGRVSSSETPDTIRTKILPITVGTVTYNRADVQLFSLK